MQKKNEPYAKNKKVRGKHNFKRIDSEYAEVLQSFTSVLNVKGRPFGQLNKPRFGMSDGNEGLQWNLSVSTDTEVIRLGVNLEGMKYKNWPISKFILSEMKNPKIREVRAELNNPDKINIHFTRHAWQGRARQPIVEKYLGGRELSFAEIDLDQWARILSEALGCLNKEKNYCGRAKQKVTLEKKPRNGEQVRVMEVSPQLTIGSSLSLGGDIQKNIEHAISELQPVYNWVKKTSQS
jgi:hypothetical protein